jgi:hypothetical protein
MPLTPVHSFAVPACMRYIILLYRTPDFLLASMMRLVAALLVLSCVQAFAPAPLLSCKVARTSSSSSLRMKLNEADFVPSEAW